MNETPGGESSGKPVILVFTGRYLPGYKAGGILRNLVNTVDFLCDIFDFKIVTRDRDLGDEVQYSKIETDRWQMVGNAKVYYLSPKSEGLNSLNKLVMETPHSVIFLTSYFDPLTIKFLVNRRLSFSSSMPVIVAPFGEFAWASLGQKFLKKIVFIVVARLTRLYQGVVWRVSSAYEADDLVRVMNPKMSSIKITGDLPIKVVQLPSAAPVKLDGVAEPVALRIIFLSRISREKNLNVALSILRSVKATVVFDIYGPTENMSYWNECQVLISELPPNVKVKYCGNVLPGNVLEIFGNYDLFLFPTGGEAYGNVIAESLTAGTPVLLSTETPWRDLEADGLGWDIELNNLDAFVTVIESVALQSQAQRLQVRTAVRARARHRLLNHDVLESNRRLFNITAND